jgi:GAF domain-containing protein
MRRRSRAGSLAKVRRRKSVTLRRPNASKSARSRTSSVDGLKSTVARLTRELNEAREQQTASGDVLKVISRSTFDLQAMLDTLVKSAARLCEADSVAIARPREGVMQFAAKFGLSQEFEEVAKRTSFVPGRGTVVGRVLLAGKPVQIADVEADPEYAFTEGQRVAGFRTDLGVPLEREGETIGVIVLLRTKVQPFTDKQIALAQNFAAQAVIAIENARLINELRQSLEQQTATADVLRVISSSPGELEPVFQAMLENATRICDAKFGLLFSYDGKLFNTIAARNVPPSLLDFIEQRGAFLPPPETALHDMLMTRNVAHRADASASPVQSAPVRLGGAKAFLTVPMFKDKALVGAIAIYRQEARPFTEKQITLLQNFAAQAVIAIENTRLLNELRQSLDRQTATSEVLSVISSSPGDLKPVFDAILENTTRICQASFGALHLVEGNVYHIAATYNVPPAYAEVRQREPVLSMTGNTALARVAKTKSAVQIADVAIDPAYREDPHRQEFVTLTGARTLISVPMLKDDTLIGVITVYRLEVQSFTDKQIELVQNFAAQAVIAIENTRLLNELRQRTNELSQRTDDLSEALEQQTATSEVLRVISSSPAELEPVFQAILVNATRLCGAKFANLNLYDGEVFRNVAFFNVPPEYAEIRLRERGWRPHPRGGAAKVVRTKQPVQIDDLLTSPAYLEGDATVRAIADMGGARTLLIVPMLKDVELVGMIGVYRKEVRPFTDKQIELVQNFAAQAVIAIENARLLNELRRRTTDLSESLEQQTATSEVLSVISRSPANIQPVFEVIGERARKLCDAEISLVSIVEGELIRLASIHGPSKAGEEAARRAFPMRLTDETVAARAIRTRSVCHVPDVLSDPQYQLKGVARVSGYRAALGVPMVRDEQVIGAVFVARKQPGLFSDAQVQLLKTFADQAVIAIENVRLFNETKNRTCLFRFCPQGIQRAIERHREPKALLRIILPFEGHNRPSFENITI